MSDDSFWTITLVLLVALLIILVFYLCGKDIKDAMLSNNHNHNHNRSHMSAVSEGQCPPDNCTVVNGDDIINHGKNKGFFRLTRPCHCSGKKHPLEDLSEDENVFYRVPFPDWIKEAQAVSVAGEKRLLDKAYNKFPPLKEFLANTFHKPYEYYYIPRSHYSNPPKDNLGQLIYMENIIYRLEHADTDERILHTNPRNSSAKLELKRFNLPAGFAPCDPPCLCEQGGVKCDAVDRRK